MILTPAHIQARIRAAKQLWLFLDYDGTLAEFAPTPDDILPAPELIELIDQLAQQPGIHVMIISGRRLTHIQKLLPVGNILLAGAYGVEYQTPDKKLVRRVDYQSLRPTLEQIRPCWVELIKGQPGFYLEDKGWSLAIHASRAEEQNAEKRLKEARQIGEQIIEQAVQQPTRSNDLQLIGGSKFLEIGPKIADKGKTVEYLLSTGSHSGELLVYLGDDDRDEQAFEVIKQHNGIAVLVSRQERPSHADFRLDNPYQARQWLKQLHQIFISSQPDAGPSYNNY